MADRARTLARLHRVRTLQLNLTRAEEAQAHDKLQAETALSARISQLAAGVAPTPEAAAAFSLAAAAHYRERLQQSAGAAEMRVRTAEQRVERAAEQTRAARRDQSAVEKLLARARADAMIREIRAMEAAAPAGKKRHDPC